MFLNLIDDAMPLSEYIVQSLKAGLNISTVEGRTTFSLDAKKLIDQMPNITYTAILKMSLKI
jgi:DNA primase